jgi:hypothetical protein
MQVALTNCGHRLALRLREGNAHRLPDLDPAFRFILRLFKEGVAPWGEDSVSGWLESRGLVEPVGDDIHASAVVRRLRHNPIQHIQRVVFEYTTVCGMHCLHCRNRGLRPRTESEAAPLLAMADAVIPLGVHRFDFIGGEVTRFGGGWLDLVEHIRAREQQSQVGVITSGWFLGEHNFSTADGTFRDDRAFLSELRNRGVTHVIFSLDGPEAVHDHWRQSPGLYQRILGGIHRVKEEGLVPRVSVIIAPSRLSEEVNAWLDSLAGLLYEGTPDRQRLIADNTNYISNLIGVGGASTLDEPTLALEAISDDLLRCKNFFRPHPRLGVRASGEVSLCPLADAGDGYGNIHERSPVDILNHLQDAFVYRLHAEDRIREYRRFLDTSLIGPRVLHPCTLRALVTMLAKAMDRDRIDPGDAAELRRANIEVASRAGFLVQSRAAQAS